MIAWVSEYLLHKGLDDEDISQVFLASFCIIIHTYAYFHDGVYP